MARASLEEAWNTYKHYMEEFMTKGTKKSAVQARKALSLIMKYSKALRQEIQDEVNNKKDPA